MGPLSFTLLALIAVAVVVGTMSIGMPNWPRMDDDEAPEQNLIRGAMA